MRQRVILIPPCQTYGDCLSMIGLIYYLLTHYEQVYYYIGLPHPFRSEHLKQLYVYYDIFFSKCPFYKKRIFVVVDHMTMLNIVEGSPCDVINTHSGSWEGPNYDFFKDSIKGTYFNDATPLYMELDIDESYLCKPNVRYRPKNIEVNHLVYYKIIGLNNTVRMEFFNYVRDHERELETKLSILRKHGLNIGDKYNIINTPLASRGADVLAKYIPNNYKTITIDNIAPCPGLLLSLIEDAETINIGDTSNVNLIYHCQYKGIMKPVYVNFHVWCNDRSWPQYNLDHAWKMMADPTLENWRFIFKNI